MLGARQLMRLHVEAHFTFDKTERLETVRDPGGAPAPRFIVGRTTEEDQCWFRYDVSDETIADLQALVRELRPAGGAPSRLDPAPVVARLGLDARVRKTWIGVAFAFPATLPDVADTMLVTPENVDVLCPHLEGWRAAASSGLPVAVALEDDQAVAVGASGRVTARVHEAGVETHPEYRRRGHATRATLAWARAVRAMNVVPLYSASIDDEVSLGLAKKMGLVAFGLDLQIT